MAQSSRPQLSGLLMRLFLLAAAVTQIIGSQTAAAGAIPLQLEVIIEGKATETMSSFSLMQGVRCMARRSDLAGLGLPVPQDGMPDDLIVLNDIPGLKYRYDEEQQSVELTLVPDEKNPRSISLRGGEEPLAPEAISGLYANYSLYGSAAGK